MINKRLRTSPDGMDVVFTDNLSLTSLKELENWLDERKIPLDFIALRKGVPNHKDCYYAHLFGQYSLDGHARAEAQIKKIEKDFKREDDK